MTIRHRYLPFSRDQPVVDLVPLVGMFWARFRFVVTYSNNQQEGIHMNSIGNGRTTEIKVRLTPQEKDMLSALSKRMGMNMSEVIRTLISTDGKIQVLADGTRIADAFCKNNNLFTRMLATASLTETELKQLTDNQEQIIHLLFEVTRKLTAIDIVEDEEFVRS